MFSFDRGLRDKSQCHCVGRAGGVGEGSGEGLGCRLDSFGIRDE